MALNLKCFLILSFFAEGTAIEDLLHADRVLIGGKQTSGLKPFNL
jgi:UDP-glucose 6-dehydrogenase